MKTTIAKITTALALTAATLQAHPGHTDGPHSHDGWPFPDIKWSIILVASLVIAYAIYKLFKKT
ncbi:MAG: hypothetical protein ACSHX6_14840 [Akkermansiaceae bacterium]